MDVNGVVKEFKAPPGAVSKSSQMSGVTAWINVML